jgi:hypothetical protein
MMIGRPELRARLWDGVRSIVAPHLERLFVPGTTEVYGGSFVSKPSSERSDRQPHQDPTVFDEGAQVSMSLWIPLIDATEAGGTVCVLPGSHRMGNRVRPPDVASFDEDVRLAALARSVPVEVPAGQIVAIDGEVVHHSPPNRSGTDRVAAICAVRPLGQRMRVVQSDAGKVRGTAQIFEVPDEHYRSGDLAARTIPGARFLGSAPYEPASMVDLSTSLAG